MAAGLSRLALAAGVLAASGLVAAAPAPPTAGGLTALPARDVAGPNLLDNGGFEARGADGGPAGWTMRSDSGVWSVDPAARNGGAGLKLSGADKQRVIPTAEQTITLEPGFYTIEGWVKTADLGAAAPPRGGVRLCLDGRPRLNWWKCTETARGTTDWRHLRQPLIGVTDRGTYRVTVGTYGLPDGAAWFDDVSLVRVGRPPLEAFLLYPNFRGMLFDDRSQTLRLAVSVTAGRETSGAEQVKVSLVEETGGAIRVRREYPATGGSLTAELDAGPLGPGTYLLRAELTGAGGEILSRYPDHRIVKTPARARERFTIWYDERNVTHLGGKPAFILGLYNTGGYSTAPQTYAQGRDGWGNARIAEAPINMLINYWLGVAPIPALEAYMDDLHARGIYYLHTVNFYYADNEQWKTIPYPAAREGEDGLNRWIARTLGPHRGLAGFYTMDERPADWVPRVFRQRRALGDGAPGTVTYGVLGDGWENQAPLWRDALDVMGLDPYPITRPAGHNHLAMVGEWTRLGQEAVYGSRPVWMVIQYFPLTSAGGWPTYEDLKTMSWMAIVEGARGLLYWSFGTRGLSWVKDPALKAQRWQDLVRVTKEIKSLEPVLLAPDAPVVADGATDGRVRALGKRGPDGASYLFAYNTTRMPVPVSWTLAEPAREVIDLDTSQPVPMVQDVRLSAELGPYQVKRYRLR